jgi:DNA repair protein RadC
MKTKLNKFEDPGFRLLLYGTNALSEIENLSIIISGTDALEKAKKIMTKVNYQYEDLARLTYYDMVEEGLSHTQCLHIIACNNYAHRKASQIAEEKGIIKMSKDIADIFFPILSDLNNEELWVMFLNRSNHIVGKERHTQGGEAGTVTDVKHILRQAIGKHAQGIILIHNHPSRNINPSEADKIITRKVKEAANLMEMQLLDHIIIAGKEYYSFTDNGLM